MGTRRYPNRLYPASPRVSADSVLMECGSYALAEYLAADIFDLAHHIEHAFKGEWEADLEHLRRTFWYDPPDMLILADY